PKLRENLAAYEGRARNNELLMRLVRDVPLDFSLEDITLGGWSRAEVNAFFERYEMSSMRTRFNKLMQDGLLGEPAESEVAEVLAETAAPTLTLVPESSLAAVLTETVTPLVAFNQERVAVLNPISGAVAVVDLAEFFATATDIPFAGHDVKGLYRAAGEAGVELREPADDTSIMAFLVDSISGHYELADVALRYLGEPIEDTRPSLFSASSDETLVRDVQQVARLRDVLRAEIDRWELNRIY
ncbi:MAG TPA: hypothetical protein VGP11_00315, partial [Acidimicrobiales bacterium]|nr:hypothetical protein [Acidimicrobiales bacterium]